ncbi:MAG: hypothetical protein KC776_26550 [Myxococcales bacterium]|nr:hypothetical protein [Myxococcales bacterium]MCB9583217.1 hypothetical protein [Polyangiaceae bacterium]
MKIIDVATIALLLASAGAFAAGVYALGDRHDLAALYWLVVGALVLRAATDMLRPKSGAR